MTQPYVAGEERAEGPEFTLRALEPARGRPRGGPEREN